MKAIRACVCITGDGPPVRTFGQTRLPVRLCTCQPGYEATLARELEAGGAAVAEQGPGWVLTRSGGGSPAGQAAPEADSGTGPGGWVFAHLILEGPVEVRGEAVNPLAQALFDFFASSLAGERLAEAWPCVFSGAGEASGLGRRVGAVEGAFLDLLKRRMGRLAKLASPALPRGVGPVRGLFVWFTDFGRAFVARSAWRGGQRRMADDPLAPSRSYLKMEEAYGVIGAEPRSGETVCDLGAAPGGWSYSAARRGARVTAVDNGPLKGGALHHPGVEPRAEDAFRFQPGPGVVFDWLFCDLVEEPHHVLDAIMRPWLSRGWCRKFVVNFKLGRVDPIGLLRELRAEGSPLVAAASGVRIRHLYHDRDEFTATGVAGR